MHEHHEQTIGRPFRDLPSFMDYVREGIRRTGLTDDEAATLVGAGNPQVGRLILQGLVKCPLERAPALARHFDGDPRRGVVIAMNDYFPEAAGLLAAEFDGSFSTFEQKVLNRFPYRERT